MQTEGHLSEHVNKEAAGRPEKQGADRWLLLALTALVALAPLPLASNRPLPAALLALAAGLLLVLWAARIWFGRGRLALAPEKLRWPLILFGLVVLWVCVQALVPMPAFIADPIWAEAGKALGEPLGARISVNPEATLSALMRLLSYAAVFWLALQLTRQPEQARFALAAAALTGAAYALYGIAVYATGNDWILLWRKWAYQTALSSTFVNRNSFATFAGLCLLCATAWFVNGFRHLITIDRPARQRAAMIAETVFGRGLVRTLAMLLLMLALVMTGSRAGTASSLVALFVLMLSFARGQSLKLSHVLAISGFVGGAMALTLAVSGGLLADRLALSDVELSAGDRSTVYAATMDAIATAPWTGTGYGTYREVFSAYRPETLPSHIYWDKAHHVYLENALELGIPATLALNLAILLLAAECLRGLWRRRRDRTAPAIGVAATVLVGLHSFFDFSLQMPAVSVLYAFMMGVAVGQSWPQPRRRET